MGVGSEGEPMNNGTLEDSVREKISQREAQLG